MKDAIGRPYIPSGRKSESPHLRMVIWRSQRSSILKEKGNIGNLWHRKIAKTRWRMHLRTRRRFGSRIHCNDQIPQWQNVIVEREPCVWRRKKAASNQYHEKWDFIFTSFLATENVLTLDKVVIIIHDKQTCRECWIIISSNWQSRWMGSLPITESLQHERRLRPLNTEWEL